MDTITLNAHKQQFPYPFPYTDPFSGDYSLEKTIKIKLNGKVEKIKLSGLSALWADNVYIRDERGLVRVKPEHLTRFIDVDGSIQIKLYPYAWMTHFVWLPDQDLEIIKSIDPKKKDGTIVVTNDSLSTGEP